VKAEFMDKRDEIIQQMNSIFRRVLDNESVTLEPSMTAADVSGWDSLSHVQLVVGIEKAFGVKFTSREIFGFKNVGDICDAVLRKRS
jgi:acyl carrier protein